MDNPPVTKQSNETEIVVYAKIDNVEGLSKASSKEDHYQLEARFESGSKSRLRQVTIDDNKEYLLTIKVKNTPKEDDKEELVSESVEYTTVVDALFLKGYEQIASSSINKTRYIFISKDTALEYTKDDEKVTVTIPEIKYEVDVFKDSEGNDTEWCKIDVEVDNILNYLKVHHPELDEIDFIVRIAHLPFHPVKPIVMSSATDEQKEFIDNLWKTKFCKSLV